MKMEKTGDLKKKPKSTQKDNFALPSLMIALVLERSFFFIIHFPFPLLLLPEVLIVSRLE